MHGFKWHDVRGVENMGFVKALRMLTSQLPSILPDLDLVISEVFDESCSSPCLKADGEAVFLFENMRNWVDSRSLRRQRQ